MRPSFGGTLLVLAATAASCAAGPAEAVATAARDLATLPESERPHVRYLTDYALPEKERGHFERLLRVHVNSLSRESELVNPAVVAPEVYRLDLRDYGWDAAVYERLRDAPEPYFHVRLKRKVRGRTVNRTAASPWLPADDLAYLVAETGSEVPVLRADWFWVQTAVQEQRAAGYYDFLGLTNRREFERLVGLNVAAAKRVKKEVAAIIPRSGVAQHNRQVFRFGAIDGGAWRTLDVFDTETGKRNAIRQLDGDFKHDAEEHYGLLANGLFACFLSDAAGNAQNTAPDKIGPDTTATGNDKRIHAYLSCVRCHREGLRPLDDYARKIYRPPVAFAVTGDHERFRRLRQLYLGELQRHLNRDRSEYEFAVGKLTGWRPQDVADAYREWWKWYSDDEVTLERAAAELGVDPLAFKTALAQHGLPPDRGGVGGLDPVLAPFVHQPPGTLRREHWEEAYQKAAIIARGGVQP